MSRPTLDGNNRITEAKRRRDNATAMMENRKSQVVAANGEETGFNGIPVANFAKGLPHDPNGNVTAKDYTQLTAAILGNQGKKNNRYNFNTNSVYDNPKTNKDNYRQYESPMAGHYFDLQGADLGQLALPPAPKLGKSELCAEMAEVYVMALLRDVPFSKWDNPHTKIGLKDAIGNEPTIGDLLNELKKLSWFDPTKTPTSSFGGSLNAQEEKRRKARFDDESGDLTLKSLFRGSAPNAQNGAYISQFMLLGSKIDELGLQPNNGYIKFGANCIDQRINQNTQQFDFMSNWSEWLEVQEGKDTTKDYHYFTGNKRFISTPRDLATYVHFDQLYQAYFNACLILLGNGVPFDKGFPNQSSASSRGAFATFGGPHLLSLLTEVASRALKVVRRQKFQIHRRARPEVIAARLAQVANGVSTGNPDANDAIKVMLKELGDDLDTSESREGSILYWITVLNKRNNTNLQGTNADKIADDKNYLLPMAFPEGSPMHPAYGAGHATVAGACVTILKAFFETKHDPADTKSKTLRGALGLYEDSSLYQPDTQTVQTLQNTVSDRASTLDDELNKLAANISIGRNMGGVHYYTDYYESLRLGERLAASIIEEQMLTYDEKVSMSFTSFDGDKITISTTGTGKVGDISWSIDRDAWFKRHVSEYLIEEE